MNLTRDRWLTNKEGPVIFPSHSESWRSQYTESTAWSTVPAAYSPRSVRKARTDCAVQTTCVVGIPWPTFVSSSRSAALRVERWTMLFIGISGYIHHISWSTSFVGRCYKCTSTFVVWAGSWCVPFVIVQTICAKLPVITGNQFRLRGWTYNSGLLI